jgi:predicted kinase
MSQLIVMIGLPGSGKSTLIAHLFDSFSGLPISSKVVSTDAIRAQLFGDESIQGAWGRIWQEIQQQFERCVQPLTERESETVVYDATNVVRRHRREVIALARTVGFTSVVGLWLDEDIEICLRRNQRRSRQVPEDVILKMNRHLRGAPPSLVDGFDALIRYSSLAEALSSDLSALKVRILRSPH